MQPAGLEAAGGMHDNVQLLPSARGQEPGWKLGFQGTDLDFSVSRTALGWGRIGNMAWVFFSVICKMIPLLLLQKLLVAPSTAERLKQQTRHDAYSGLRKPWA